MRLSSLTLPFVLVESDDRRVQQARAAGFPVIYGDATQPVGARGGRHPERARAILVTVPAFADVRSIVRAVRQLAPDLPIIARAEGPDAVRALYALGIQEVTSPEFEAAIEMTRQALMHFNLSGARRSSRRQRDAAGRYDEAGETERLGAGRDVGDRRDCPPARFHMGRRARRQPVRRPHGWMSSGFGRRLGASIVGIIRSGSLLANPDGEAALEAGDLVAVLGTRDQIARFETAMRRG